MNTTLTITDITLDPRCQPRAGELDSGLILDYVEAIQAGATFPPVTVFHDGDASYLADGFHRIEAARIAGRNEIAADYREGGLRDAILHAVGANSTHGKRRTNADKRLAVMTLLEDTEWSELSDREIARRCGVSQPFVSKLRRFPSDNRYHADDIDWATRWTREAAEQLRAELLEARVGLDRIRGVLTREQYISWLEAEFGLTERMEARMRQHIEADTPDDFVKAAFTLNRVCRDFLTDPAA